MDVFGGNVHYYYRPQTKLWEGNIFTPYTPDSFCSQRVCGERGRGEVCVVDTHLDLGADTPKSRGRQPHGPRGRHPHGPRSRQPTPPTQRYTPP